MATIGDKRSFEEMFGGAPAEVDYAAPVSVAEPILPMPLPSDDLSTIATKMEQLAKVVADGRSIAVRTGYVAAKQQQRDPILTARAAMTPAELEQFEAWESDELSEMEVAEMQTAHKVVAIAMDKMNATFRALRLLSGRINSAKDVIQAREHAIKAKLRTSAS
ncbi:hypothetical protein C8A00DRAFT_29011 [Chaetomidium leptoderma]|uniref:Uncharacterized protein n=1 Tax=Chaetomidium leptoderma TaxID=669021 RepID=A0AAN6VVC0_9PEZI|nr:hypothetical protein C8A00DRAFT_29011 [Chaetomidium leptoderma]